MAVKRNREHEKVRMRTLRNARRTAGLCGMCGEAAIVGRSRCQVCRTKQERSRLVSTYGAQAADARSAADSCALCFKSFDLCIDHDHRTGVFRGILCRPCNRALGLLKDSPEILERALPYLRGGGQAQCQAVSSPMRDRPSSA